MATSVAPGPSSSFLSKKYLLGALGIVLVLVLPIITTGPEGILPIATVVGMALYALFALGLAWLAACLASYVALMHDSLK